MTLPAPRRSPFIAPQWFPWKAQPAVRYRIAPRVGAAVSLLVAIALIANRQIVPGSIAVAIALLLGASMVSPALARQLDRVFEGMGTWAARIVSWLLLAPLFVIVFTAVRLWHALVRHDPLQRSDSDEPSYWLPADTHARKGSSRISDVRHAPYPEPPPRSSRGDRAFRSGVGRGRDDAAPEEVRQTDSLLLGWSPAAMLAAIKAGGIDVNVSRSGLSITRAELLYRAAEQWPFSVIESALGTHAASRLPAGMRMHPLPVPVHQYAADALHYLATTRGQSPALFDERAQVAPVEHLDQVGDVAVQRGGQSEQRGKAGDLRAYLQVAYVRARHLDVFSKRLDRKPRFVRSSCKRSPPPTRC